jgi:Acyl carrier protein phosphodiesterase
MATMLYVTCNLKPTEASRSMTVGKAFLDEYLAKNPDDEVYQLDLYRDHIQRIDADVLSGWGKLRAGANFASLTEDEQRKVARIWRHADQFIAADKYVFVTPMFNLGFPPEFKMYIDAVCVAGKTFAYTKKGPMGLLNDKERKCLHIHSSGGFHYGKEEDHSVPYLKSVMTFMGIVNFEAVVLEGVDAFPDRLHELNSAAHGKARTIARSF